MIRHFTHPHPLTPSKPPWCEYMYDYDQCSLCQRNFDELDQTYSCRQMFCHYYVHRTCALSEEQISHPFHPQHKLNLLKAKHQYFRRNACSYTFSKYGYHYYCEECHFVLDLKCAALIPIKVNENMINHKHPPVLCDKPNGNDYHYICNFCAEDFKDYDRVYVCQVCHCLLHESCAALPREIRHPFHPEHPLTLLPVAVDRCKCDVCDKPCYAGTFLYHCSSCRFNMDVHCITLKPTAENSVIGTSREQLLIIAHPHPHPLIQCHTKEFQASLFWVQSSL
ncbi:hypothetical protein ACH5RR_028422 [Cinchona calisaya]|uniref:DC1 domain-containing protein n=1 Tax=Cinchona calisaya TaxID=153742 RepID=A0ABD2YQY7_9GENT